jgi:hypothetical protein
MSKLTVSTIRSLFPSSSKASASMIPIEYVDSVRAAYHNEGYKVTMRYRGSRQKQSGIVMTHDALGRVYSRKRVRSPDAAQRECLKDYAEHFTVYIRD